MNSRAARLLLAAAHVLLALALFRHAARLEAQATAGAAMAPMPTASAPHER